LVAPGEQPTQDGPGRPIALGLAEVLLRGLAQQLVFALPRQRFMQRSGHRGAPSLGSLD